MAIKVLMPSDQISYIGRLGPEMEHLMRTLSEPLQMIECGVQKRETICSKTTWEFRIKEVPCKIIPCDLI